MPCNQHRDRHPLLGSSLSDQSLVWVEALCSTLLSPFSDWTLSNCTAPPRHTIIPAAGNLSSRHKKYNRVSNAEMMSNNDDDGMCESCDYLCLLFYHYVTILDPDKFCEDQRTLCSSLSLKGRLRISSEGINGLLGGSAEHIHKYVCIVDSLEELKASTPIHWKFGGVVKNRPISEQQLKTLSVKVPVEPNRWSDGHMTSCFPGDQRGCVSRLKSSTVGRSYWCRQRNPRVTSRFPRNAPWLRQFVRSRVGQVDWH